MNNRTLQIERELMIRLYGRESFCDYRKSGSGELWNPNIAKWAEAMGAEALQVCRAEDYAPAVRRAINARGPVVIDVDVAIDIEGYRSIWYPYPKNFYETWTPGPGPVHGRTAGAQ